MHTAQKILIVDDTPANLSILTHTLEPAGYEILAASGGDVALRIAARAIPDLILLDVMMPVRDGFEICRELKKNPATREIPVIFITARTETNSVLAGFRAGGVDYILKPFEGEEVLARVKTHLQIARLTRDLTLKNQELAAEIERRERADAHLSTISDREAERWGMSDFIGESQTMRKILSDIQRLQHFSNTSVLITGESGTGKELVARAIHHASERVRGPFIPVNCVAIPTELAESLFFGHMRGSFTGASADRKGWFEQAHGGTLFLDEIGDMPAALQAKLLRVLEDGQITPIGANQSKKVDVRILAATNANLTAQMAAGRFRRDLFFRLARYVVETTPLRKRTEDIPLLATHFLKIFAQEMGLRPPILSGDAIKALADYPFPGNIRELKNVIERALIESGGSPILPSHLCLPETITGTMENLTGIEVAADLPFDLEKAEGVLIQRALAHTGGNVTEAARLMGVHRSRIYRRLS